MSTLRERERPKHVKYASVDPLYPNTAVPLAAKTHTRRRTERDLPCAPPHLAKALLTPPLTPASSIRTSGSSRDSALESRFAGPENVTADQPNVLDPDPLPTRIVLLDNLDSALPVSALESSVVDAVLGATSAANNPVLKSLTTLSNGRSACLVFFDVRCAKALVHHVTAGHAATWFQNVAQGSGDVDASFLTAEETVDFLDTIEAGSSFNADQVEGSVYLTVQKYTKNENDTNNEKGSDTSNHDINTPMLLKLLKSFGSLRRFEFDAQSGQRNNSNDLEKHKQTGETIVVYHLEYHDLRDAEKAVEELDGRTMFGVSLGFGIAKPYAWSVNATTAIEAAEAVTVEREEGDESTTPSIVLAPAGVQSNMRKRFRFAGDEGAEDSSSDTGVHTTTTADGVDTVVARDALLEVGPVPGGSNAGTPSPTFFYTSSMPSAVASAGYVNDDASSQPKDGPGEENAALESHITSSGHPFRSAHARLPGEVAPQSMHSFVGSIPNWDGEPIYHPQQQIQITEIPGTSTTPSTTSSAPSLTSSQTQTTNTTLSPCYGTSPDGVCHYCPSRGPHPAHLSQMGYGATYPGYGLSPPPLPPLPAAAQTTAAAIATAGMYYPPPTPMPLPGQGSGQGPAMSMQIGGGGYEYLDSQMQVGGSGSGVGVVMTPQQAHPQIGMGGAWAPGYHHDPSMVPLSMGMGLPGVGVGMNMMNMGLAMSMPPPPPPPLPSYMGYVQRDDASALVGGGVAVAPDGRTYLYSHYPQLGHGLPPNYPHSLSHGTGHFVPQAHGMGIGTGMSGDVGLNPTNSGPDSSPHAGSSLKGRRGSGANQLSSMVGTPARSMLGTRPPSSSARRSGSSRLHHSHTQQRQQNLEFEHAHRPSSSPSPVGIRVSPSLGSPPPLPPHLQVGDRNPVSDRNQLNIARIEEGLDTRTTVMIKNIPNKMSDRDLIVFIEKVCPRRIDFFYLRMDFQNGCNVGYAFVNFIHVQDLLRFAKARLGVKWNMFSSEKVLQMSYANYQGKEALVEKFKNSAIMDERESWRPRIFYSSGQNQGLPEPFPPPTHMRRKERSSYNRGALFVPGVAHDSNEHGRVEAGGRGNNSLGGLSSRGPLHRQFGHGQFDSVNGHWHGSRYYADASGHHHWRPSVNVGVEHDSKEASRGDELSSMYGKRLGG